jgi:hypothetical protein
MSPNEPLLRRLSGSDIPPISFPVPGIQDSEYEDVGLLAVIMNKINVIPKPYAGMLLAMKHLHVDRNALDIEADDPGDPTNSDDETRGTSRIVPRHM